MSAVLSGIRVLEVGGIGPGPHAAMMLADLGADVVRIDRPQPGVELIEPQDDWVLRGRRSVVLDLKTDQGVGSFEQLVAQADVLIEGFRPGVMEKLGLGPESCLVLNPNLVYGRMTGWGQDGPLAQRAGHDINYLAVSGVLHSTARAGQRPFPPLNLVGDLGGGSMLLVVGVLAALVERTGSGRGQVVDAAMVDGASTLMAMYWSLVEQGRWSLESGTNVTDGAAPFYDTYECSDGKYVAVGAIEPKFYRNLIVGLGFDPGEAPDQMDSSTWPMMRTRFESVFASRTRDVWAAHFFEADACVTPVLALDEVADHPHITARHTIVSIDGIRQPAPAPRFSRSEPMRPSAPRVPGSDKAAILREWTHDSYPSNDRSEE